MELQKTFRISMLLSISGLAWLLIGMGCSANVSVLPVAAGGQSGAAHASGGSAESAGASPNQTTNTAAVGGRPAQPEAHGGASGLAESSDAGASAGQGGDGAGGLPSAGAGGLASAGAGGLASAGAGGSSAMCGGPTNIRCPLEQLCEVESYCGALLDPLGVCVPVGRVEDCEEVDEGPSCGCEGKIYHSTCQRRAFGVPKALSSACTGIATYPSAYGVWMASRGDGGKGPAVVVTANTSVRTWDAVLPFPAETPPSNPTATQTLSLTDTDDLFLRLEGVPVTSLPHLSSAASDCHSTFYFRLCAGCALREVNYDEPSQVLPEMSLIWSWFDRILGATAVSNPRNFCK